MLTENNLFVLCARGKTEKLTRSWPVPEENHRHPSPAVDARWADTRWSQQRSDLALLSPGITSPSSRCSLLIPCPAAANTGGRGHQTRPEQGPATCMNGASLRLSSLRSVTHLQPCLLLGQDRLLPQSSFSQFAPETPCLPEDELALVSVLTHSHWNSTNLKPEETHTQSKLPISQISLHKLSTINANKRNAAEVLTLSVQAPALLQPSSPFLQLPTQGSCWGKTGKTPSCSITS